MLDITDTWMSLYTSGTTGRPKGARITYRMALFNAVHATSSVALGVDSTNLVFLPTFHAAGLHLYANPIFQLGATNVVLRTFDPRRFLALLASKGIRITHLLGVPTNFPDDGPAAGLRRGGPFAHRVDRCQHRFESIEIPPV